MHIFQLEHRFILTGPGTQNLHNNILLIYEGPVLPLLICVTLGKMTKPLQISLFIISEVGALKVQNTRDYDGD